MITRTRPKYSASHGGHAPGHLRDALVWTLPPFWDDEAPWWAGLADEEALSFFNQQMQARWDKWTPRERGRWLCGQLWNCTDIMPASACDSVDMPHGTTYAKAVRKLKAALKAAA